MNYLEGVYWDLDGTIANTELEAHLPAFNNAFKDLDIDWNWDAKKYIHLIMATLIPLAVVALAGPAIIALVFYRR